MIKVASYNIHKAVGTDRRRNPERIIDVLNEVDADIIALQEADRRFGERHAVLPDRLLEMHSDYVVAPLGVRTESMGWHGNALLARRGAVIESHDVIHLPCLEPRGAVTACITIGKRSVRIIGMHLDLSGLWRRKQAAAILHFLAQEAREEKTYPTIAMGDLNEWNQQSGCLRDFCRMFQLAPAARSFHARRPIAALDRIMWHGPLDLMDSGVHLSAVSRRASDHLPIWARFA